MCKPLLLMCGFTISSFRYDVSATGESCVISISDSSPEFHRVQSFMTACQLRYDNRGACRFFFFLRVLVVLLPLAGCFSVCVLPSRQRCVVRVEPFALTSWVACPSHITFGTSMLGVRPTPQIAPGLPSSVRTVLIKMLNSKYLRCGPSVMSPELRDNTCRHGW